MFCQGCGKEISDDTKFCPACGRPTDGSDVPLKGASQPTPASPKSLNNKMLLIIGIAVIVVLVIIILLIGNKGKSKDSDVSDEVSTENVTQHDSKDSALSDFVGDWRVCKDIQSNSYAFDYEVPYYLRIESEGLTGVAEGPEIEGDMESWRFVGETVYFSVGTNKMDSYEENGNEYFEFSSELYEKGGNGRHDVGIRFYYNNSDNVLVMELNVPEDGDWVRCHEYKKVDSIQQDRIERGQTLNQPDTTGNTYHF